MTGKSQVFSGSAAHRVSGFHLLARLHDTINHALLRAWCAAPSGWMRGTIRTKAKAPVRRNTFSEAVAAPTDKRGFVTPNFWGWCVCTALRFRGVVGVIRKDARTASDVFLTTTLHPMRVETPKVALVTPEGAKTLTTSPVASRRAAPTTPTTSNTSHPDPIALHADACNALSMALHYLRQPEASNVAGAARKAAQALAAMRRLKAQGCDA